MQEKKHMNYLDSLKGISIIAVTMIHAGGASVGGIIGKIGSQGARGVQMFFLISGILNYISAERMFGSSTKIDGKTLGIWYYKKITRLLPLYYLSLIISLATESWSVYWLGNEGYVSLKNIFAHIFLVHGFFPHYTNTILGVDWYLGVLIVYILITPLIYKFVKSVEKSLILLIIIYLVNPIISEILGFLLPISEDPVIYNTYLSIFGPCAQIFIYVLGITIWFVIKKSNRSIASTFH